MRSYSASRRKPLISVVVPCYNEEAVLAATHRRLVDTLSRFGFEFETIYVDDGSSDRTPEILRVLQAASDSVRVLRLSRNFGHQIAVTAGLEHAGGDAVVLIDADLQDPPELLPDMVAEWLNGYDVVYGVRADRDGETPFKLWTAKLFYRLINLLSSTRIPLDTGDFRLMDRKVVDAILAMPERDRFLRGMISWVGFRQTGITYHRAPRAAGTSKYPFVKMVRFAADGVLSFSIIPLRLATWLGFATSLVALIGIVVALGFRLWTNRWVTGWASLFLGELFLGGVQLICVGIIGEYVGRIYGESKNRPLYFLQERLGFDRSRRLSKRAGAAADERAVGPRVVSAGGTWGTN